MTWNRKYKNYAVIIIATICMLTAYIIINQGVNYEKNIPPIYNYVVNKNSNYEVELKPNTFYETENLPAGGYYPSKAISKYKINFEYIFQGDKKANFEYTYNITANLVGTVKENDNQEKEVWNRSYILNENTSDKISNVNEFSVQKGINIDYDYYNNLARSYEKTYGITINSILKLNFNISYLEAQKQKIEDTIELKIPLTNTISEVEENYEKTTENSIKPKIEDIQIKQIIYYIFGGIFILFGIILITIEIINKNQKEPIYNYNINHILKYYKNLIVTITNELDLSNLKVMKLLILDDLIDLAEQNQVNIIHYKVPNKEESNLYVIINDYAFIYVVTNKKRIFK